MSANPETLGIKKYQLGEVVCELEVSSQDYGIPSHLAPESIRVLDIYDPYEAALSHEERQEVLAEEAYFDELARTRRQAGHWDRKPGTVYVDADGNEAEKKGHQWGDPVVQALFKERRDSKGFEAWKPKMPAAAALLDLSDPFKTTIVDARGNEVENDRTAMVWMASCSDGSAIRKRGTVLAHRVSELITNNAPDERLKWMSIACGTALPTMQAALRSGMDSSAIDMTLVDWNTSAMDLTEGLAEEINFKGKIDKHTLNIFDPHDCAELRSFLGDNGDRPYFIDLMGIFEYTGEHTKIDPATFLRSNYDMLRPGGSLNFAQMLSSRPFPDFTMGVIGWPYIQMRSHAEIMQIVADSGIDPQCATLYLPSDGVYAVCEIRKPQGAENFLH